MLNDDAERSLLCTKAGVAFVWALVWKLETMAGPCRVSMVRLLAACASPPPSTYAGPPKCIGLDVAVLVATGYSRHGPNRGNRGSGFRLPVTFVVAVAAG